MVKLRETGGMVCYLEDTGPTLINRMTSPEKAREIVSGGKAEKSGRYAGFDLCVDGRYYFSTAAEAPALETEKKAPTAKRAAPKKVQARKKVTK